MSATAELASELADRIAGCPTPEYHDTHRYCPSCPWTEQYGREAPEPAASCGECGASQEARLAVALEALTDELVEQRELLERIEQHAETASTVVAALGPAFEQLQSGPFGRMLLGVMRPGE